MIQTEQLFGTPLIVDDVPVPSGVAALPDALLVHGGEDFFRSVDLGTARWTERVWPAAAMPIVSHMVALANQGTYDGRKPNSAPDWTIALSLHSARGQVVLPRLYAAFWTALYVIRISDGSGDRLNIPDPRLPMPMAEDPNLRLRHLATKTPSYYQPMAEAELVPGAMFLFPSWLDVRYVVPRAGGAGGAFLQAGLIAPLV